MSFFDKDEKIGFKYVCENGHTSIYEMRPADQDYSSYKPCLDCEKSAQYAGFLPRKIGTVTKVAYDQNGRKAYRISDGSGNVTHISQTKYHYLQKGKIEPQYTSSYNKMLQEGGERYEHLLKSDVNKRFGKVEECSDKTISKEIKP